MFSYDFCMLFERCNNYFYLFLLLVVLKYKVCDIMRRFLDCMLIVLFVICCCFIVDISYIFWLRCVGIFYMMYLYFF